jgi:hypothetical protein
MKIGEMWWQKPESIRRTNETNYLMYKEFGEDVGLWTQGWSEVKILKFDSKFVWIHFEHRDIEDGDCFDMETFIKSFEKIRNRTHADRTWGFEDFSSLEEASKFLRPAKSEDEL